jgi:SAM-dependent methyltransferase
MDLSYRVVVCDSCGFAYATDLAPPETYQTYYQRCSKYDTAQTLDYVSNVERERALHALKLCLPVFDTDNAVLDLGCGHGVLLNAFRLSGFTRLWGLDPAQNAPEIARRLFAVEGVRTGMLRDSERHFDLSGIRLFCLAAVLEHMPEAGSDMTWLTERMSEGSHLLVEVPALERFCRPPFEPFGEFSLEHVNYFSAATLDRLLRRTGLSLVQTSYLGLEAGSTDSLFALYRKGDPTIASPKRSLETGDLRRYIAESQSAFGAVLEKLDRLRGKPCIIYGAGSHTARLIPRLADSGLNRNILFIVDSNPNLQGKTMSSLPIHSPQKISAHPEAQIIISTFRAQHAIAAAVAARFKNPSVLLYP